MWCIIRILKNRCITQFYKCFHTCEPKEKVAFHCEGRIIEASFDHYSVHPYFLRATKPSVYQLLTEQNVNNRSSSFWLFLTTCLQKLVVSYNKSRCQKLRILDPFITRTQILLFEKVSYQIRFWKYPFTTHGLTILTRRGFNLIFVSCSSNKTPQVSSILLTVQNYTTGDQATFVFCYIHYFWIVYALWSSLGCAAGQSNDVLSINHLPVAESLRFDVILYYSFKMQCRSA